MGLIKKPNELTVKNTLSALIYGQPGMGKAQPLYCSVLTPEGYKKLSDISVGDTLMGCDGKEHHRGGFCSGRSDVCIRDSRKRLGRMVQVAERIRLFIRRKHTDDKR